MHFAIGNFIRDALTAEAITSPAMVAPCAPSRSERLGPLALHLAERGPGHTYNVGSDEVISIAHPAHLVRDLLAPNKPVHILGQSAAGAARNCYVPDIRKVQRHLGLGVTVLSRKPSALLVLCHR